MAMFRMSQHTVPTANAAKHAKTVTKKLFLMSINSLLVSSKNAKPCAFRWVNASENAEKISENDGSG
jgi:hypothetical protein